MVLSLAGRWLLLLFAFLGHSATVVYAVNRINATGLGRYQIKRLEKIIMLFGVLLPCAVLAFDYLWLIGWLGWNQEEGRNLSQGLLPHGGPSRLFLVYGGVAIAVLAPGWLWARRKLWRFPKQVQTIESVRIDTCHKSSVHQVFSKRWVKCLGSLPWNQLHLIEVNTHAVHFGRLASPLHDLRIGHFSDVHLTGYMHRDFYRHAIDGLMAGEPDIVVFSGDLIDFDECLNQVQPLLELVQAPLGCYFVLGNHDRRLRDVPQLRRLLSEIGWHDLGSQSKSVEKLGEEIFLVGNEKPWFNSERRQVDEANRVETCQLASLKIGVAHSPDQLPWARKLGLDLLFCGHTHGGQVRLPVIGPLVAPSWYGSRYASGWFDESPTLMHVSRGLSGTHPLRIACTPEVSVCILKSYPSSTAGTAH